MIKPSAVNPPAKKWPALILCACAVVCLLILQRPIAASAPKTDNMGADDSRQASITRVGVAETSARGSINNSSAQVGVWLTTEEVRQLPQSGPAWEQLKEMADQPVGPPDLSIQTIHFSKYQSYIPMIATFPLYTLGADDTTNITILAKALVYARTGKNRYREEVEQALGVITYQNTEDGGRTLSLGRKLVTYVIAADLIILAEHDPALDRAFREKLRELLDKELDGRTLRSTHEHRPNNWGTHAGASRAAVAVYLGDKAELDRTAFIFKAYLGDTSYKGFIFGDDLSWQCDPAHPVGVNPQHCVKQGHVIDGALPDEMRRGGSFKWPPEPTGYPWEGLQGAIVQAQILHRAGYPAWEWEDQALLRAARFLYNLGWPAEGDDTWQPWLFNSVYGTAFPSELPARPGKNMGFTDWTHAN
ncbi:MAG: alginate lyase family protein [Candidatus Promineifilaceae bacterium]|nr:alginate lyase family protein [Candidatus Promineifilaceae bacterium]